MGFTEMQAAQAFFACEKNEMLAANFLFENSVSLREEMAEELPAPAPPPEAKTEVKKEAKKEQKK
jgi:hypothetical protein